MTKRQYKRQASVHPHKAAAQHKVLHRGPRPVGFWLNVAYAAWVLSQVPYGVKWEREKP
jgi:hypothetical protein